ncbi:MAG: Ppx/GppA phosphatase [bacterium]|nr:MAG: Ppx/GppA phosphatase [bacterium]KAF0149642.1 MAG: Ppx/GppA phosphatase [bacterium]KAF0169308.1 MAG: Ppx/GppA phosphatase [bacterium]
MQSYPTLAAVDLGSNSFHLQVGRVEGEQLFYLDAIKEPVRLASGLTARKALDGASQRRALNCLARFGERLRGMPPGAVRAVGTSALRVAKNSAEFLDKARQALGFDIDIVAGREEARLIYLGVAHSLPLSRRPRLVVDIGGGSTECIRGVGYEPRERESLRMGCVVYSLRFFPGGRVDKAALRAAETAARIEIRHVTAGQFGAGTWKEAVGSSGTAKALGEICRLNGFSDGALTLEGLKWLRERLVKAGSAEALDIPGLKPDRRPVLAGGLGIMYALFLELGIETMTAAQGAMREGILWDLLGRVHDHDMRDVTVSQLQRRYGVDTHQAGRVEALAAHLFAAAPPPAGEEPAEAARRLAWAARLHEIGISIAHSGQHKHAAYILENADMPGFSRRDQARLAALVRASRGGLDKFALSPADPAWPLILCLRLALLFNTSRGDAPPPDIGLACTDGACSLRLPAAWLRDNPLTQAMLEVELRDWAKVAPALRLAGVQTD